MPAQVDQIHTYNTFFSFKMQLSGMTMIDKRISLMKILSFSDSFVITGNTQNSKGPEKIVVLSLLLNMLSFYSLADNF